METPAHTNTHRSWKRFFKTPAGVAVLVAAGALAAVLLYDHRVHAFTGDGLLVVLLLACVASHFFMHRGHGGHGGHDDHGGHGDGKRGKHRGGCH